MAKVYITAIRRSGGSLVRHITHVWFGSNSSYSISDSQIATSGMADLIDSGACEAWVKDPASWQEAKVIVVRPHDRPKYLRTKADDDPNDNLLSLPEK